MDSQVLTTGGDAPGRVPSPEELLERGELLYYPTAPFPLPQGADRNFLLHQRLAPLGHKNISYDPATGRVNGFVRAHPSRGERLRGILADFSREVSAWLAGALPRYASGWAADRATFRPEEEATRRLRLTARNDLLHIDAFPNRPSHGRRLLRVYANVNPDEPRVWMTSEPFARLLARYGPAAGLPHRRGDGWLGHLREGVVRLLQPGRSRRPAYDAFMLRFHNFLKRHDGFQERAPRKLWTFPPGSAWVLMADGCTHAVLRGRYALEHSYFVSPECLALPDESPAALLTFACFASQQRAA
jgi:hypothetical protein